MKFNQNSIVAKDTPSVNFKEGVLEIDGVCMPENATDMFKPIFDNLKVIDKSNLSILLNFKYLNSMSSKQLLRLLFVSSDLFESFNIVWSYSKEDDLMKMKGKELKEILENVKFELKQID